MSKRGLRCVKKCKLVFCLFLKFCLKLKAKLVNSLINEDRVRNVREQLACTILMFEFMLMLDKCLERLEKCNCIGKDYVKNRY